jgi:transposase
MEMAMRTKSKESFEQIFPDTAGIDIGSAQHSVSVPPDRHSEPVQTFSAMTFGLEAIAAFLSQCRIRRVAMESTGVYWIPLFELLSERGFEVTLVDARRVKNVAGRKSDVLDCDWLRRLHSCGLLEGAFRPADEVCGLRAVVRHRMRLIEDAGRFIQRMQKALHEMNLKLDRVVTDITGTTGMQIVRAIIAGERDPEVLARFRDKRCKATALEIEQALTGRYRTEHVYVLRQLLATFDHFQGVIGQCDQEIERRLVMWSAPVQGPAPLPKARKSHRNTPKLDLHSMIHRLLGVDVTGMPGMDPYTVLRIVSETGTQLAASFPSIAQFCSWLGLCPGTKISGGKIQSGKTLAVANKAARAFRLAAHAAGKTETAIGAFYRRIKSRAGAPKAITATAHKMARIFYHLVTRGENYQESGAKAYDDAFKDRVLRQLKRRAQSLGYALTPCETAT